MAETERQLGDDDDDSAATDAPSPPADFERPASRRTFVVLALAAATVVGAAVLALELFVAERIPQLTEERLAAAESLWLRQGPTSYDMDVEILGARPGPVHVEVRGGEVTAMTRDGRAPAEHTWQYWTVPARFDELTRELEIAADPVHELQTQAGAQVRIGCEFDQQYGYPRRYQRLVYGGGPDIYWHVTNFVVR